MFDSSKPIIILSFLIAFQKGCNANEIPEDKAMWVFQFFMENRHYLPLTPVPVCAARAVPVKKGNWHHNAASSVICCNRHTRRHHERGWHAHHGFAAACRSKQRGKRANTLVESPTLWARLQRIASQKTFLESLRQQIWQIVWRYWDWSKSALLQELAFHALLLAFLQSGTASTEPGELRLDQTKCMKL